MFTTYVETENEQNNYSKGMQESLCEGKYFHSPKFLNSLKSCDMFIKV